MAVSNCHENSPKFGTQTAELYTFMLAARPGDTFAVSQDKPKKEAGSS